jgi:ubiquinone biosynthesis protein
MMCALRHDYEGIADALYAMGTPTKSVDMNAFRAEVSVLSERYLGKALKDIELSALIRDLIRVGTVYGIEIPSEFAMVGKSLMTVEGIGKEIDPDFDIMEEGRPLFSDLMRLRYSPERLGNDLLCRLERLSGATYNVPQRLDEVLSDLRGGRLRIRTQDPHMTSAAESIARHLFSGLTASALLLSGAWLLADGMEITGYVLWGVAALWIIAHLLRSAYLELRGKG